MGGRGTFELNKRLGLWILKTDFIYGISHCYFLQEAISQVMPHTTATAFDCEFSVLYALHVFACLLLCVQLRFILWKLEKQPLLLCDVYNIMMIHVHLTCKGFMHMINNLSY